MLPSVAAVYDCRKSSAGEMAALTQHRDNDTRTGGIETWNLGKVDG